MKRIGIFHMTARFLVLGIAGPACGRQGKPDKQEAKPEKPGREAKPERQHEERSSRQGQEPQVREKQDQRRDASERQQQQDNSGKRQEQTKAQQDQRGQEYNSANRRQANIQQEERRQQQQDKSKKHEQQIAKRQQDQERQQQKHRQDASENDRQESGARQDQQRQQHQDRDDRSAQQRSPSQADRQHVAWQSDRARSWKSEHRSWQQRGGYNGYRVPDDRFRSYYGQDHGFRIYSLPVVFIGGRQRFQYGGYWFGLVDPWPEYWSNDWYDSDDVYVDYYDDGYYLYNRRYPGDRISISFYLN